MKKIGYLLLSALLTLVSAGLLVLVWNYEPVPEWLRAEPDVPGIILSSVTLGAIFSTIVSWRKFFYP